MSKTTLDSNDDTLAQDSDEQERAIQLSQPNDESPGDVVGYTILHSLGKGAFGSVWLARENNTGKRVAIKFYSHKRGLDWSLLNREVERLAVLYTSRNIVRLLDVGWDSDPPYYIMEHLENGSLAALLADGPIPVHEAVRIAKSVSQALVHAHGSGILHCDLKPANVLLDVDYEPRLCDFGQSRLSDEQNPALGTLFYMAPEQADLKAVPDARWDVYALGALLYHMLTGAAPYRNEETEKRVRETESLSERLSVYRKTLKSSPPPTAHRKMFGVDKRLAEIIDRCLRLNPEKRFANAQAVLEALKQRDRFRSRRPLIGLGIIGPAILLFALMPYFASEMSNAVDTLRKQLTDRALESNVLPAELLAGNLKHDLENRAVELEIVAQHPDLIAAIKRNKELIDDLHAKRTLEKGDDQRIEETHSDEAIRGRIKRYKDFATLQRLKSEVDNKRESLGRPIDQSWFLTEARGFQLWRSPYSPDSDLDRFEYRDYFHGKGADYAKDEVPAGTEPIEQPHVSVAFASTSSGLMIIGISVPVRDFVYKEVKKEVENNEGEIETITELERELDAYGQPKYGEVIGVLARTIELFNLLGEHSIGIAEQSQQQQQDDPSTKSNDRVTRHVALIQCSDGMLLDHPWLKGRFKDEFPNWEKLPPKQKQVESATLFAKLHVADSTTTALKRWDDRSDHQTSELKSRSLFVKDYRDPVGQQDLAPDEYGGTWLAAFAHVSGTGWATVVQERKDSAMQSVEQLQNRTMRSGIIALLLGCSLIGLLWYFVARALNERTFDLGTTRKRNRSNNGGPLSTTSTSSMHSEN